MCIRYSYVPKSIHEHVTFFVKIEIARLGGKRGAGVRGPGVRGVENAGSGGKRGVPFFSPKYEFSSVK